MNVLIIDDHPLTLKGMRLLAQQLGAENDVVIAPKPHAARQALANRSEFDLALLAIHLDVDEGFALLGELRSAYPALPIVVVSASGREHLMRAVELGATGFLPHNPQHSDLLSCLVLVLSVQRVRGGLRRRTSAASIVGGVAPLEAGGQDDPAAAVAALDLTPRRKEVLTLMLRGQSNKLIARELNLSIDTIKDHVTEVLRSLKVESRTQAAAAVSELSRHGAMTSAQPTHRSVHRAA
jgi:DNA-binding NarL/FixJ family response regulator